MTSRRQFASGLHTAVRGKGTGRLPARILAILRAYSWSPGRLLDNVVKMADVVGAAGGRATFFVPGAVLSRHAFQLKSLDSRIVELAIHGQRHRDYSLLDDMSQRHELAKAWQAFADHGLDRVGFRAPYLRLNSSTLSVAYDLGAVYDASAALWWDVPGLDVPSGGYKRGLEFCGAVSVQHRASLPWLEKGVLRIPTILPDDESLVERLGVRRPQQIAGVWIGILERAHDRGQMFTLSLHPERFLLCADSLRLLLQRARELKPPVWLASLADIAAWWERRESRESGWPDGARCALAVTGDIDALTIGDFVLRLLGR